MPISVPSLDHFEVLGVSYECSPEELTQAYRKRAKETHPDGFATSSPEVREQAADDFKRLAEAHDVLKDSEKRLDYLRRLDKGPVYERLLERLLGLFEEMVDAMVQDGSIAYGGPLRRMREALQRERQSLINRRAHTAWKINQFRSLFGRMRMRVAASQGFLTFDFRLITMLRQQEEALLAMAEQEGDLLRMLEILDQCEWVPPGPTRRPLLPSKALGNN